MALSETEIVTAAVARMFRARGCLVYGQVGNHQPQERLLDLLAIEHRYHPPGLHGVEVKVSRADFIGDKKWTDYLPMCNRFWWACPTGLIQTGDIARETGLIWYDPDTRECRIVRWPKRRPVDPDWRVLLGLIWRGQGETRAATTPG